MGRIRTIKPEFPQSQSMGRVSRDARLTFIQLWTLADDSGRLRGNSRMLASLLFPYDDDAPSLMSGWLGELEREKSIERYVVDGCDYVQIRNWLSHQKIDKPSASKLPGPATIREDSPNARECSSLDQGPRTKDRDGTGEDEDRRPAPSRVNASEKEIPGLSESDRKRWAELLIEPQPFPGMVDGNSTASLQSLERVDVVRWFQGALATSKPLTGPSALDLVLVLSCAAKAKTKGGIANRVAYFAARLIGGEWVNDTGAVVAESQWLAQQFRDNKVKTVRQREECAA